MKLLILQQRPSRAGAQTSLARLLESLRPLAVESLVLCSEPGWLSDWCAGQKLACEILPAPKARSLRGRLYANHAYVGRAIATLHSRGFVPDWLIANDTEESLHAGALAHRLQKPWAVILRNSALSRAEFLKYQADAAQRVFAVGDELQREARSWIGPERVRAYREGLLDAEFFDARPKPAQFPTRILIAGSEQPRKGWQDFVAALGEAEQSHADFPALQLALTGAEPADLLQRYRGRAQFRFLGRINGFSACVREYDLAIHPSRNESFGLAPFEILAAGVPVLCSQTGAINERVLPAELRFPPGDAHALAQRLRHLWRHWPQLDFRLPAIQQGLRFEYSARAFAEEFAAALREWS